MKHFKNFTLLILTLTISGLSYGQWTDISPTGGNGSEIIYDLYFSSDNNGIAVGHNPGTYEGLVYTTNDGGTTWSRKSYPGTGWFSIHFTDVNNGLILGRMSDGGFSMSTQILRTKDAGATWELSAGQENGIREVSFVNDKVGYSIGGGPNQGDAGVQKTTDGGKTWTSTWSIYGWFLSSIHFVDENVGFIAGSSFTSGYSSVLAKTTDGGKTFTEVTYANEKSASGLSFISSEVGYVLDRTSTSSTKLSKTVDQGESWSKVADMDKDMHLLQFNGDNDAFAAGLNGKAFKSNDAGLTWTAMPATGYSKTIRNTKMFGKYIYVMGQNPFIGKMEHGSTTLDYLEADPNAIQQSEFNTSTVKLFPNPVSGAGVITIQGAVANDAEFTLINSLGKVVYSTDISNNEVNLNSVALTTGVYFYQINSSLEHTAGKLIIEQ